MSSSPQLSADIWHIITQNKLFTKPYKLFYGRGYEVDLRDQNDFTSFMGINRTIRKVFLSHFMQMKEIEFNERSPRIKMFRDKKKIQESADSIDEDNSFYGPYLVTRLFVGTLIDYAKLNLSSIKTCNYFDQIDTNASKKPCNFAIQTFCNLFLKKEVSDEEAANFLELDGLDIKEYNFVLEVSDEDAANIRFELDELDIKEYNFVLGPIFEELLNLNAKEVRISSSDSTLELFDCSLSSRTVVAKRTEKFSLELKIGFPGCGGNLDGLKANWQELLSVLLLSCLEIRQIDFIISYDTRCYPCFEVFMANFGEMIEMFVRQIFPNLSEGNSNSQINVFMELKCTIDNYEKLLTNDNELLKVGQAKEIELDKIIAHKTRECQVADKLGRTHKCEFKLLAYQMNLADLVEIAYPEVDFSFNDYEDGVYHNSDSDVSY